MHSHLWIVYGNIWFICQHIPVFLEAVVLMSSLKTCFKKFHQILRKTAVLESLNKVAGWRPETIWKETLVLVFFCEFGKAVNPNKAGFFEGRYFLGGRGNFKKNYIGIVSQNCYTTCWQQVKDRNCLIYKMLMTLVFL